MTKDADRDPSAHVEITGALDIPNVTALATLEHEIETRVGGHHISFKHFSNGAGLHRTTSVPTPASVKISSRMECGIRPSTNCTFSTPLSIADSALSTFGIIPSPITPLSRNFGTSLTGR